MARKRYTAEEIIGQLRAIEIELGEGLAMVEACRKLGITEQTYYRSKTLLSFFFKGKASRERR